MLDVVHYKGMSLSALREISSKLCGENDTIGESSLTQVARSRFSDAKRTIALPLEGGRGREHKWDVADANVLIANTIGSSEILQELFSEALTRSPSTSESPWRLLISWDEFTPGSLMVPDNQRKAMVVNMSFQELGPALHSDSCWWTIAVARTKTIGKVVGGWSRMFRDLLKLLLCSPSGMQTVGMPLRLRGQFVTIFARVGCLLSDGDGLRMALQWLGSSSLKPCFRHWNVLKKNSERAGHSDGTYVEIDCHDSTKFRCWTCPELLTAIDVCAEAGRQRASGTMSQDRLEKTHRHLGFRATQDGLLADADLRRCMDFLAVLRYDWPHTFLADGIVGAEMWALIGAGERHGLFSQEDIHDFLKLEWHFASTPTKKRPECYKLLTEQARKVHEEANTVKASMGDLLGLYGVLRHFVEISEHRDDARIAAEVQNFFLVCKAVDLLLAAKRRRIPVPDAGRQLLTLLELHLESHMKAHGGNGRVRPKTHWAFDIAQCMMSDDYLMDTFTTERLHLRAKGVADNVKKLDCFEASVMAGITNVHFRMLSEEAGPVGLVGATMAMPGAPHVTMADKCKYFGVYVKVGDFVFRGTVAGSVPDVPLVGSVPAVACPMGGCAR